jgi:hypothetical protein
MNVVGTQGGPETFKMEGVKCEGVGKCSTHGVGLQNTLEAFKGVGGRGMIHEDVRNTLLVMHFSSHSVAAVYHW